jgi:hypothetical protein
MWSASETEQMRGLPLRVAASLLGGIAMNVLWLVAVLTSMPRPASPIPLAVMMTVPAATAIGFGVGTLVAERGMRCRETTIAQAFLWPLVGCTVGAVLVYPFVPMLIGTGTLAVGTGAVVARELRRVWNARRRRTTG